MDQPMSQGDLFVGKLEKKVKLPEDLRVNERVHTLVTVTGAIQGRRAKEQFRFIFMEGLDAVVRQIGKDKIDAFLSVLAPHRPETPRIAPMSTGMPQNARKRKVS